ncbi:cilia- and flagella-associated protein 43 isoform X2 [Monodelphis domestica]|uniref:cilia- and flagella-associated protein 43 isoform X2 n=1 Tax=Monodelphis domestica TaxID=13616 RepID=UPI00044321B3|nr:cilia- and flagella-associated protein 43 isoform X2 [Monodelphis domestica]
MSGKEQEGSDYFQNATLSVRWVQGFPMKELAFINNTTICYPCGNFLIFLNIEKERKTVLQCMNGNVGAVATNIPFEVVAFSDRKFKPSIYIYNYPALTKRAKLKGNAQLDYTLLQFSHSGIYLASYSSIPEHEVTLWNWETKVILCRRSEPGVEIKQMTFNPKNWRQLCLSSEDYMAIWNIERCDKDHYLKPKQINMPSEDGTFSKEYEGILSQDIKDPFYGPVLPVAAIAGLVGLEAENFKPKDFFQPPLHPVAHCWNSTNDIYVCCEEGQILLINGESLLVTILSQVSETPEAFRATWAPPSLMTSAENLIKEDEENYSKGHRINSMAVYKEKLFIAGEDGILCSVHIKDYNYTIKDQINVQSPVESIFFSPDCKQLLILTDTGSIFSYVPEESKNIQTILEASTTKVQAIDFITPGNQYCMSITVSGEFYIWMAEDGFPISKLCLKTKVGAMACCPSSFSVAVGTTTGRLLILNVYDVQNPRLVHNILLTSASIQHMNYDQNGMFLIIGASDRNVFILSAKASEIFKIIGYTDSDLCSDERGRLKNEFILRTVYETDHILSSAVLDFHDDKLYGFCSQEPYICTFEIPKKKSKSVVLELQNKIPSKHYGTGMLYLSFHGQWLVSIAKDGILSIRDIKSLEPFVRSRCHSYHGEGIQSMAFSLDGQFILMNGKEDGALVCLKWKTIMGILIHECIEYLEVYLPSMKKSIEEEEKFFFEMKDSQLFLDTLYEQSGYHKKHSFTEAKISDEAYEVEITWLQKKNREAIRKETKEFSEKKRQLKDGIKSLNKTIQDMLMENELADYIAQLDQKEFSLDVEEIERLYEEREEELEKLKKEAEMDNLAKKFLCHVLKEECWDSMKTKGTSIKSFHNCLEVKNFPMKERNPEELEELERVFQLRKIEIAEYQLRKEIAEVLPTALKRHEIEEEEEEEEEEPKIKESGFLNYLFGSLSYELLEDTSLLYSQLELHTREEKINQIILLKDIIYNIKTNFNKEFTNAHRQKNLEIARVKERNVNIGRIIDDLNLRERIWQPELEVCENPERMLVVEDHEIKVERILTPWEKEQAEIAEALELERLLLFQADDARQRALMDMMGGVLQVKKEDILKMEIPPPAFTLKSDAVWTEDERKQFKEYEKKVKDLNDEREKYKKSLDAELKRLQTSVYDTTQTFDKILKRLFGKKVKCDMVINQEELKIAIISFSLLIDEELLTRELELNSFLERKQSEKIRTYDDIYNAREKLDAYRETYDILIAEDKVLERGFKKEFSELPTSLVETLYKMFKRRPRQHKQKRPEGGQRFTPYDDEQGFIHLHQENLTQLMKAMKELDNPHNMPEGLELSVWNNFCALRRSKVENEQKVKQKALVLLEMQTFLRKRTEDDDKVQADIEKCLQEIHLLQEEKMNYQLNSTIQILITQGQVELENFHFVLDFTDSILINRVLIEDINSIVRTQGQKKIASMIESKNFHNGITQIEWEHKKMEMEMEDLNQKAWDIQILFLSKERQKFLKEANYEILVGHEIFIMEQTLANMEKTHKREVDYFKKLLKQLGKCRNKEDAANFTLSCELRNEMVSLCERREICKTIGSQLTCENIANKRYEAMLQQQKLIDVTKIQAEQISILQAEVERLRMRTFPALIQM